MENRLHSHLPTSKFTTVEIISPAENIAKISAKRTESGFDVMITIFGDFCQFLAKKLAFFLKITVMITFLQNPAVV
jgi:hypothetical protein